ncbi:MAG TPA: MXAN_6577-like cysteine-rich protein [Polyangiaceae bacterium]|nr:MXAN_6577-like cysteine-rich protein [Polyangiaceae bacterium]
MRGLQASGSGRANGARAVIALVTTGAIIAAWACSGSPGPDMADATTCSPGQVQCGGACTDLSRDHDNCGACGSACKQGELCSQSHCATSCGGGTTQCGNTCTMTQNDPQNCGSCGTSCKSNEFCSAGKCTSTCGTGTTACGQSCVDTKVDSNNCGSCGTKCVDGKVCNNGSCASACGQGSTLCGGGDAGSPYCALTQTDNHNCGSCFNVCGQGELCANGTCTNACAAADGGVETLCSQDAGPPYCSNLQTDNANCGSCGTACSPDAGGGTCCSGTCVDLTDDKNNCGSCGNVCGVGSCAGGQCGCSSILVATGSAGASAATGASGPVTGDACYELWGKTSIPDGGAGPGVYLGGGQNIPGQGDFVIYCYPSLLGVEWNASQALELAASCSDGNWHHIAACRQANDAGTGFQFTLFFDGVQLGSKAGTINSTAGILTVGGWGSYPPEATGVQIDEVRISSTLRYTANFTPSRRFSPDAQTVSLYHFDEGTGTTSADSSGNGYTLTFSSGVTWQTTCP